MPGESNFSPSIREEGVVQIHCSAPILFVQKKVTGWMGNDDKSTVRLPVAVFITMLGAATLGGGGAGSFIEKRNTDKLPELEEDVRVLRQNLEDVRTTADAALSLAAQNGVRVNDNRQDIFDSTRKRWSAIDHDKYAREVDARFLQVERRLDSIERDVDRLQD